MSFGSPERNLAWVEEEAFLFEVWQDVDKTLAITYGAANGPAAIAPRRVTRVLDAEGRLMVEYNDVEVGASPQEVLEDCRRLFGAD